MADRISPELPQFPPPPEIEWGSHIPNSSASPQIRLRCALLDFLSSNTIKTAPHALGPYFDSTTPKTGILTRYNNQNGLNTILTAYGLDTIPNASTINSILIRIITRKGTKETHWGLLPEYSIYAEIEAYDINREAFIAATEDNVICPLSTSIIFQWATLGGAEDVCPSLDWSCVVAIIAHENSLSFKCDGTDTTEKEHNSQMMQDLNPLRHLGYLGWPGAMPVVNNNPVLFFRRS
jgi:hypothetical protein